jgi:hypothetical protein
VGLSQRSNFCVSWNSGIKVGFEEVARLELLEWILRVVPEEVGIRVLILIGLIFLVKGELHVSGVVLPVHVDERLSHGGVHCREGIDPFVHCQLLEPKMSLEECCTILEWSADSSACKYAFLLSS